MIKYELNIKPKWLELRVHGHAPQMLLHDTSFNHVCGMVSAVAQTCVYGVIHYCHGYDLTEYDKGKLRLKVRNQPIAQALLLSCIAGLNAIKQEFPNSFEG